jgi:hypothetical protein
MKNMQKIGGLSALFMGVSHLAGIIIFMGVLKYASITDPMEKLAVNIAHQPVIFSSNLLMYVIFGFALILLALALNERLKSGAPALMQAATAIGIIWAGSLIASGMVANAGLLAAAPLYAKDPSQAATLWQAIEAVANGLGNANGEILGGPFTFLVSLAALRSGALAKRLNYLGLLVGAQGILSVIPALTASLVGGFGVTQILWFVWLGILLLCARPNTEN